MPKDRPHHDSNETTTVGAGSLNQLPGAVHQQRSAGHLEGPAVAIVGSLPGERSAAVPIGDKTVISKTPPTPDPIATTPMMTSAQVGQALLGKRLDHYELVEFVGGGGMGAVFRAHDSRLGRTVAVKVLSRDSNDEETIRRFRNEAQSAARLDHPNIARVHFVGEDAGCNYIVFEFIEGINLRDLVEQSPPMSLDDALSYTLQVAEALAHAASRDVVHRDIKPSNVLVTPSGNVKLVDMGLARLHQVESSSDDLTASGVTLGTFDYISPEQARDPRSADVRSDIYSLGCTLFYILAGRPPFPEGTALQKLLRHNGDDPPDIRQFRPELSPRVSTLIHKMLAKRPSQRPQTPAALIKDILSLADQLNLTFARRVGSAWASPTLAPSFWQRAIPIAVPVVVLIVALTAIELLTPANTSTADVRMDPLLQAAPVGKTPKGDLPAPNSIDSPKGVRPVAPVSETTPLRSEATTAYDQSTSAESTATPPKVVTAGEAAVSPMTTTDAAAVAAVGPKTTAAKTVAATPAKITRIAVRPRSTATVEGVETVESLDDACRRAVELGINEVELQFDGELIASPLEISSPRLTIRSGAGFRPKIVFQPEVAAVAEQRQMIRLNAASASRLSLQGVQILMELPRSPSFGWSVFALNQMQSIELTDCVVTVSDVGAFGGPVHDEVAVFTLTPRQMTDMMSMDEESAMAPQAMLTLGRTIVRGEATLVSLPDETPLKLNWTQGMLLTSRRLIETGGARVKPKWFGRIEADLNQVTIVAQQGLHQMRRRNGAAHRFDVDVRSTRCILFTAADAPLFEFADVVSIDNVKLTFDGADNCYPRPDMIFARVKLLDGAVQEFDLENRSRWSTDRRPDLGIVWRNPAPIDLPLHAQTAANYVQADGATNDAGFDPSQLPTIDEAPLTAPQRPESESLPAAKSPMSTTNTPMTEATSLPQTLTKPPTRAVDSLPAAGPGAPQPMRSPTAAEEQ